MGGIHSLAINSAPASVRRRRPCSSSLWCTGLGRHWPREMTRKPGLRQSSVQGTLAAKFAREGFEASETSHVNQHEMASLTSRRGP